MKLSGVVVNLLVVLLNGVVNNLLNVLDNGLFGNWSSWGLVDNRVDNLLHVGNLLGDVLDVVSNDGDLLGDDWSLWSWTTVY